MYICICNAVTDREIVEQVQRGAASIEAIRFELGVATCCGLCTDCATKLIEDTLSAGAAPADAQVAQARQPSGLLTSSD
jgi:bacterioferritin-associated ferredoxin